jgi:hypothetical protein
MPVVMIFHGWAGQETPPELFGTYVQDFDLEAHGARGQITFTRDLRNAHKWPTFADAMATWNTQSKTVPTRPDGKPNKPMTAMTIEVKEVGPVI